MDDFLDLLVKKSDIKNNSYFNYRQPVSKKNTVSVPKRVFANEPSVNSYVVFDFETTGLNPNINNILEIGAVKVIDGKVAGSFNQLVNPHQYIPGYISSKIHITNSMVEDKEDISRILPDFLNFIGDLPLIAHNASFDMAFLDRNAKNLGFAVNNKVLDTLRLSRKYNTECKRHNLGYLSDFYNISLKNAHRAYCDAYATHCLYQIIRKKYLCALSDEKNIKE